LQKPINYTRLELLSQSLAYKRKIPVIASEVLGTWRSLYPRKAW
jgi:hypothetical protein